MSSSERRGSYTLDSCRIVPMWHSSGAGQKRKNCLTHQDTPRFLRPVCLLSIRRGCTRDCRWHGPIAQGGRKPSMKTRLPPVRQTLIECVVNAHSAVAHLGAYTSSCFAAPSPYCFE